MNENLEDKYEVLQFGIRCLSKSGGEYLITKLSCSCVGFSYRRTCRHYEYASKFNLLDKIQDKELTQLHFTSPYIVAMRIAALKAMFKRVSQEVTDEIINLIEPRVTRETSTDQILEITKQKKGF